MSSLSRLALAVKSGLAQVPGWVRATLLVVHLLALAYSLGKERYIFPDSDRYLEAGRNLMQHGELYARPLLAGKPAIWQMPEYTIRPPAYPVLTWLMTGGSTARPVLLLTLQHLLSLISISVVFTLWAKRCKPDRRSWCWALGLILSFPAQVIYASAVMSEGPLQACVLVLGLAGAQFWRRPTVPILTAAALALALALLLKPVFFPFAGVLLMAVMIRTRRPALVAVAAFPLVVALSYMCWNWQRTGYFHFSSIADINLLHYNAAGVVRQLEGAGADERWTDAVLAQANQQPSFRERQQYMQQQAMAVLKAHPLLYAWQHSLGMLTFFLDPGRFDLSYFLHLPAPPGGGLLNQLRASGTGGLLQVVGRLPLGQLLLLAVVGLGNVLRLTLAIRGLRQWRQVSPGTWWLVAIILYVAALTGPLGAARFLVPVWPLLLLLALRGLSTRRAEPA